jgi:hypothetical protein
VAGCVATGDTVEETTANMKEDLQFHIEEINGIPHAKGISRHLADGIFDKKNIANEYFITEIKIEIPQHV